MALVTVRVVPRSAHTSVSVDEGGRIVGGVRSAPEGGRATAEAARALAEAVGVAPSRIVLRMGARSRTKVFAIEDLSDADVTMRLRATREA
ncbi:MAG: DUF167 domain-containing protein [Actinomycetota bacterium]